MKKTPLKSCRNLSSKQSQNLVFDDCRVKSTVLLTPSSSNFSLCFSLDYNSYGFGFPYILFYSKRLLLDRRTTSLKFQKDSVDPSEVTVIPRSRSRVSYLSPTPIISPW